MDKSKDSTKSRKLPLARHSEQVSEQEADAQIATLVCKLTNLRVVTTGNGAGTILAGEEPVALGITVDFGNSGAIALMPLGLRIRVDFFAKPIGRGEDLELGTAILHTAAHQFTYTPTLAIEAGLATAGLVAETAYRLTALLRVGAPDYPAFATGVLEGLMIQIYS